MAESNGKFNEVQLNQIRSLIVDIITVGNKLQYTETQTFDNDLDIVSKAYVDGLPLGSGTSFINKSEADILGTADLYYLEVPELTTLKIWEASYTTETEDPANPGTFLYATFYLNKSDLQDGKLYSFPDPLTNVYSIQIVYI